MDTKARILEASVQLFNEEGFVNVSLRDISSKIGISSGNLAYHFKNKGVILEAVYQTMQAEIQELMAQAGMPPSFSNITAQIEPYLQLQEKYRFFSMDTLELCRANPTIARLHRNHTEKQIASIRAFIDYSVGTGNLLPEPQEDLYDFIALNTWMIISFWSSQEAIRAVHYSMEKVVRSFWSPVIPYLTEKGKVHFENALSLNAPNA